MYKRTLEAISITPPPKNETCMCKAQFGNAKYAFDVAFTIPVEIDSTGAYCLIEYDQGKEIYGLSRTRHGERGKISKVALVDYTMCIHTLVGGGWPTMQVLVVEVYD